ncbi:energy transducer TonB [Aromatoleum sp.]|uniref:energy transducer TonB n=1 Tax=Aromatoleum sp. TaxID=2307007 RepID=UPI002FCC8C1E
MALSHSLPAARFPADSHTGERPPLTFAAAREKPEGAQRALGDVYRARSGRARAGAPRPLERRLILALVAAAHLAAAIGFSQFRAEPVTPPPPISVALIEPPVVIPTPAPPPALPTPPKPEIRKQPPPPKPVVTPAPPKPVKAPVPPAPVTEAASAIRNEEPPPPVEPAVAAPAPAAAPVAAAPRQAEAPPSVAETVPARFDAAYLNNPTPAYPPLARRMREEGKVLLRVFVTADGAPGKISVSTSSGSTRLDTAAENAVARWRFVPAKQDGRSVDAWVVVPIVFKLEG